MSQTVHTDFSSDPERAKLRAAKRPISADALMERIVALSLERRGEDVVSLDMREVVQYVDHMVIVTGRSSRQIRAIGEHVIKALKHEQKLQPLSRSGLDAGAWVCLDYVDVVLHILDDESRTHYDLELLWDQAKRTEHAPTAEPLPDPDDVIDEDDDIIRA